MEKNFGKLEELIKDDDKIATVASFACEADVSIVESKETFEKYVEINKGSKEINITYILNGKKKDKDHLSISLVKHDNLKEEKELYQEGVKQIIFSIQKAKDLDFNVIGLVELIRNNLEKDPISGTIIGKNCIKRTLRKKVLPTLPPATIKGKSTIFTKQNSLTKSVSDVKVEKGCGDSNQSNKNKANTQGSITNIFSKAAQNKKPEQKTITQPEKKQKTSGFANFFTKPSSKESQNNEVKEEKQEQKTKKAEFKNSVDTDDEILIDLKINEEIVTPKEKEQAKTNKNTNQDKKSDLFDSDTDEEIMKDLEIKEEKPAGKKQELVKKKNKNKHSQKKKRAVNDVGNDKSAKKRKRIIVEDDSDSDVIFGSEKSDNEVIESSEESEPIRVEKKPLPPKNKRRMAVDKIYEDEEGYIVTKTEYVYETPSEDENEPENKIVKVAEKPKPKIEKKISSNSENDISPKKAAKSKKGGNKKVPSGNQPTLMNFFKKK